MTKRPENECRSCGRTWYPRGSDYSAKCPNCGSVDVADAVALRRQREESRRVEHERLAALSRAETARRWAEQREREYLRVAADLGLPKNVDRRILDFELRRRSHLAYLPLAAAGAASAVALASLSLPGNKATMLAVGLISTLVAGAVLFVQLSKPRRQLTEASPCGTTLIVLSSLAVALNCGTYLALRNYPGHGPAEVWSALTGSLQSPIGYELTFQTLTQALIWLDALLPDSGPLRILGTLILAGYCAVLVAITARRSRSPNQPAPMPPGAADDCVSIEFREDSINTVNVVWVGPAKGGAETDWVAAVLWSASMARPAASGISYPFPNTFAAGTEIRLGVYDLPVASRRMKLKGFPVGVDWRVFFLDGTGTNLDEKSSDFALGADRISAFPKDATRVIVVPPGRYNWRKKIAGVQLSVRAFPPDAFREAKAESPQRPKSRTSQDDGRCEQAGSSHQPEERAAQRESRPTPRGGPAESVPTSGPHAILGVSRTASPSEIRSAYLLRCTEYHPDKVAHLGVKLQAAAEQEMKEIQSAYDQLGRPK